MSRTAWSIALLGLVGSASVASPMALAPAAEPFQLAAESRSIFSDLDLSLHAGEPTNTKGISFSIGVLPEEEAFSIFSYSALEDSPNFRTGGTDELGRPLRIPADTPYLVEMVNQAFPTLRAPRDRGAGHHTGHISFSAFSGDGANIYDLLDEKKDAPVRPQPPAINFKGESVSPATVPYFNDFESGARGLEWNNQSNVTSLGEYTTFTGPLRRAREVIHVRVQPGQAYFFQMDLYMVGMSPDAPVERSGRLEIAIDGAPMVQNTFGGLRAASTGDPLNAEQDDEREGPSNGFILRELRVRFVASSDVAQIEIEGDTGPGFGAGSWGFDNVLVDEAPETNLGTFAQAEFSPESEAIGANRITYLQNPPPLQPTVQLRERAPRRFRQTYGQRGGLPSFDFFPEDPDDPDDPDDEEDEEPEGPIPDEEVPSPGPAVLFMIAGAAGMRRRR